MKKTEWFDRRFVFGLPAGMLPFYLERLEGTIARISTKVAGVPEALLSARNNGKWSVKENIAHLAEVDEIANRRINEIVSGISPMSPAVFEPKPGYNDWPIAEILAFFEKSRRENLQAYSAIADSDLLKTSMHPRLKVSMSVVDLAWFDAEHDDHHLVTINGILRQSLRQ